MLRAIGVSEDLAHTPLGQRGSFAVAEGSTGSQIQVAVGQNMSRPMGSHFGVFGAPPILEPILVGLGCSLGVRDFDPWPGNSQVVWIGGIFTPSC